MQGRNPMKGRHNVGVQMVSTGKTRSGQSEPASNKGGGITGTNTAMQPKPPVKSNNALTSVGAERQVKQPPQPFANPQGAAKTSAPSGPRGAKPGLEPKGIYAGKSGSSVGQSNPSGKAVGQGAMPNQSKQIGGRMGFPPPARKAGNNASSFKSKKNASFYGE